MLSSVGSLLARRRRSTPTPAPGGAIATAPLGAVVQRGVTVPVVGTPEMGQYANGDWFIYNPAGGAGVQFTTGGSHDKVVQTAGVWKFRPKVTTFTVATSRVFCDKTTLLVGNKIIFNDVGTVTGISAGVEYFILTVPVANTYTIAATAGGTQIVFGGSNYTTTQPNGMQAFGYTDRTYNGAMVNPGNHATIYGGTGSVASNNRGAAAFQGFDSLDGEHGITSSTSQNYSDPLNVAEAYTFAPGEEGTYVKMVGRAEPDIDGRAQAEHIINITVVNTIPVEGSLRPAVAALDKTPVLNVSDLSFAAFQNYDPATNSAWPGASYLIGKVDKPGNFAFSNGTFNRNLWPFAYHGDSYGGYIARFWSDVAASLHYDFPERLTVAMHLAVLGIDCGGVAIEGARFPGGTDGGAGGGNVHWIIPLGMAALLAPGAAITDIWKVYLDFEQDQLFANNEQVFVVSLNELEEDRQDFAGRLKSPFYAHHYQMAEWSTSTKAKPDGSGGDSAAGSNVDLAYRRITGDGIAGFHASLHQATGGVALINADNWDAYQQRLIEWTNGLTGSGNNCTDFVREFIADHPPAYPTGAASPTGATAHVKHVAIHFDRQFRMLDAKPALSDFVVTVDGTPVALTGAVQVWGPNVGVELATALTAASQVVRIAYTQGTNRVRTLAGVDLASVADRAVTNLTLLPPPDALTPQFIKGTNTWLYRPEKTIPSEPTQTKILIGVSVKILAAPTNNQTIIGNVNDGTSFIRWYTTGTAPYNQRLVHPILSASRLNGPFITNLEVGEELTMWGLIDSAQATAALMTRGVRSIGAGAPAAIVGGSDTGSPGSSFDPGVATWLTQGVSLGAMGFISQASYENGNLIFNEFQGGISRVFIDWGPTGDTAIPAASADPFSSAANFRHDFDWGPRGENVIGRIPKIYWPLNLAEAQAGIIQNRGTLRRYDMPVATAEVDAEEGLFVDPVWSIV